MTSPFRRVRSRISEIGPALRVLLRALAPSRSLLSLILVMACIRIADAATLLLEAESFADKGGWVVDQQFMDQMGSPFLLAHGLGVPVKPATTTITIPT